MQGPTFGLSQQADEAGGSLTLEAQERARAASTTTERDGTARRFASGKQDGTVERVVNQWLNPLKRPASSNLADMGWPATHADASGQDATLWRRDTR
jgi:hypothetical protein